jgi:hypothetical protein
MGLNFSFHHRIKSSIANPAVFTGIRKEEIIFRSF